MAKNGKIQVATDGKMSVAKEGSVAKDQRWLIYPTIRSNGDGRWMVCRQTENIIREEGFLSPHL